MSRSLLLGSLLLLAAAACDDDETIDPESTGPAGDPIDREAILGSIEDVRAMVQQHAQELEAAAVENVHYEDGRLTVTLAPSQDGINLSGLEAACEDISRSVGLPDLAVVVEKADGSERAECGGTG